MQTIQIIKQPPARRARRKRRTICYVMVKKAGRTTIATTLPRVVRKGG